MKPLLQMMRETFAVKRYRENMIKFFGSREGYQRHLRDSLISRVTATTFVAHEELGLELTYSQAMSIANKIIENCGSDLVSSHEIRLANVRNAK